MAHSHLFCDSLGLATGPKKCQPHHEGRPNKIRLVKLAPPVAGRCGSRCRSGRSLARPSHNQLRQAISKSSTCRRPWFIKGKPACQMVAGLGCQQN